MKMLLILLALVGACTVPLQQPIPDAGTLPPSCVLQDVALRSAANAPDPASMVTVPIGSQNVSYWRAKQFSTDSNIGVIEAYAFRLHFFAPGPTGHLDDVYDYDEAEGAYMLVPVPLSPDVVQVAVENLTGPAFDNNGRLIFAVGTCETTD